MSRLKFTKAQRKALLALRLAERTGLPFTRDGDNHHNAFCLECKRPALVNGYQKYGDKRFWDITDARRAILSQTLAEPRRNTSTDRMRQIMNWPKKISVMNDQGVYVILDSIAAADYGVRNYLREYTLVAAKVRRRRMPKTAAKAKRKALARRKS